MNIELFGCQTLTESEIVEVTAGEGPGTGTGPFDPTDPYFPPPPPDRP